MGSKGRLQNVYAHKPSSIDTLVWHSISPCASTFFKSLRWTSNAMCPLGPPTTTSHLGFQFITYDTFNVIRTVPVHRMSTSASQYQNISEMHAITRKHVPYSRTTPSNPHRNRTDFTLRVTTILNSASLLSTQHEWRIIYKFGVFMTITLHNLF